MSVFRKKYRIIQGGTLPEQKFEIQNPKSGLFYITVSGG